MTSGERPIGDLVNNCHTWNPKASGVGSFDYIDLSSIDKDTKSIASIERHECSEAPSRARQVVEAGDVLVATVRPNLNGVALVNGAQHGMTASTGYCVLRPHEDKLDSRFLFHWVKTRAFVQRMVDVATGANYPAVSDAKVKASTIPLPPLAEQKRIAAILDAADALRAKRRESLAGLDTLLQSTFLDMFGDPVTNPMGWDRITFGDLISTGPQNGIYKPSKDYGSGVRILRIDGFYDGAVSDLASLKRVQVSKEEIDTYGLLETDIVINRVNSRSHLGKCALVPALEEPVVFESNMMRLSVDAARMLPRFVTEFFQTQYVKNQILSACKDAVNQSSINQGDVKGLNVLVPPIDVQHRFAVIVESIEQQKASQRAHLDELNTLFASLQSRAFRGDL